jgi:hypothetical protein
MSQSPMTLHPSREWSVARQGHLPASASAGRDLNVLASGWLRRRPEQLWPSGPFGSQARSWSRIDSPCGQALASSPDSDHRVPRQPHKRLPDCRGTFGLPAASVRDLPPARTEGRPHSERASATSAAPRPSKVLPYISGTRGDRRTDRPNGPPRGTRSRGSIRACCTPHAGPTFWIARPWTAGRQRPSPS